MSSEKDTVKLILIASVFLIICFLIPVYSFHRQRKNILVPLQAFFPDARLRAGSFFFRLMGFSAQLSLPRTDWDGLSFYVSFSGKSKPSKSLPSQDRIFEVTFMPMSIFDKLSEHLADGKKYLKIRSSNPMLREHLPDEDGLLGALYDFYIYGHGISLVSLALNKNGIEMCFGISPQLAHDRNIIEITEYCIKACEQALKVAARAGIKLNAPNPFQDFQGGPGISHNPELDARSDEAFYNSLDDSLDGSLNAEGIAEDSAKKLGEGTGKREDLAREKRLPPPPPLRRRD